MDMLKRKQYQTQSFFPQTTRCSAVVRQGRWQWGCICSRRMPHGLAAEAAAQGSPRDSCEAAPLQYCCKLLNSCTPM